MADLGAVTVRTLPLPQATLVPVEHYNIIRGKFLGPVSTRIPTLVRAEYRATLSNYVVRQIRIIYKQLWPSHGQRFPQ